jgi:hypothetical protein
LTKGTSYQRGAYMTDDEIEVQILELFNNTYEFLKFERRYILTRDEKSSVPKSYFRTVGMIYR